MPGSGRDTVLAQQRIARLAARLPLHRAFGWLHLHQPQLRAWQLEAIAIPAPPFAEADRAAWFLERFRSLGLSNVHLDQEGNALGELPGSGPDLSVVLVSAHLDTVFPAGTVTTPVEDGERILGPGACDNGAGLAALLGLIAALRAADIVPGATILFAANVGEEGEGDLRGMRFLFQQGPYKGRISTALALEGAGTTAAVDRALGSRRFRVSITGPGGHSWTDAGAPNPILLLARALATLGAWPLSAGPDGPRTTLSAGQIGGGTSINSIPSEAFVLLDLRSTDPAELRKVELEMHRTFELVVSTQEGAKLHVELIGDRPAASLPAESALLGSLRAVDRHLGLRTELRLGSTDSNVPLALGVPALALAAGGSGGGIHTLAEWYDPTGREIALRRILLLLLDTAGWT